MVRAPSSPPRPPALDAVSPCLRASSCLVLTSAIPRRVHVLLLLYHRHYLHHLAAVRLRLYRLRLSGLLLRWACDCPCTHLHAPPITAAPALAPPACPPAPPPPRRRHVAGSPRVTCASPALGNQRHQALLLALLLLRLRSLLVVLFLVAVVVVDRGLCGTCAGAQTAARAAGGVARGHALQRLPRHCVGVRPRSNRLAVGPQVLQRHLPRHPQHRRTCTVTSVSPHLACAATNARRRPRCCIVRCTPSAAVRWFDPTCASVTASFSTLHSPRPSDSFAAFTYVEYNKHQHQHCTPLQFR